MEETRMEVQSMSKSLFHATEKFDTTIYCLVSRQDFFFLPISVGKLKKMLVTVSTVG
jgi:hypothetical protein